MTELEKCFIKLLISNQLSSLPCSVVCHEILFSYYWNDYFLTIRNISLQILWQGSILISILQKKEPRYKVYTGSLWPSQDSRSPETWSNTDPKVKHFLFCSLLIFSFHHKSLSYKESLSREQALRTNTHLRLFAKPNQTRFLSRTWVLPNSK